MAQAGARANNDEPRGTKNKQVVHAYGASGAAVMSVYENGGINAISIEGGTHVDMTAIASNLVKQWGRPSIRMRTNRTEPAESEHPPFSDEYNLQFNEWASFKVIRGEILTQMAALAAMTLLSLGRESDPQLPPDSARFMSEMSMIDGPQVELLELRNTWLDEAMSFVKENWAAVERVAQALLEQGTLEYDAIAELTGFPPEITDRHPF